MTFHELWVRLTYPVRRSRIDRDLREEMSLHVQLRAERLQGAGVAQSDAAMAARRQFGNAPRIADASRAAWGWGSLDGAGQDLRYVARQLRHSPGFALVVVLTMAFGIGINTAAFTFYDAVVLKPLAVRAPGEMVRVIQDQRIANPDELPYTAVDLLRRSSQTLDSVMAISAPQALRVTLSGHEPSDVRPASARFVSPDYFAALGVRLQRGRAFTVSDDRAAVISHAFWSRALTGDTAVIGRLLSIGGVVVTIVGVAPATFAGTGLPAAMPDVWLPLQIQPVVIAGADWRFDGRPHWQVLARLASNVQLAQARAELAIMQRAALDSAGKSIPLLVKHATFFQADSGEFEVFQQASAAFMVALALVLGIAVVNLVNLLAARNAGREREVTVRLALGASRARIARQLASESLLLAAGGGALGLALSWWFAQWLRTWIVGTLAAVTGDLSNVFLDLTLDWRVVAYAAALSCVIGLGVGVWPAIRAARSDVNAVLKQGVTSTTGRAQWSRRNLLLATQVAGCLVLLTAAGMLLSGTRRARAVETGFDSDHMLVLWVEPTSETAAVRAELRREIERRLGELPEVRAVAWAQRVPFAGTHLRGTETPAGHVTVSINGGSTTIFDALGIPILDGRAFTAAEVDASSPVVVITEAMARLKWPGENPIGKGIPPGQLTSGPDTTKTYVVIGVVKDVRTNFLSRLDPPSEYFPHPFTENWGAFLVRTRGKPTTAIRPAMAVLAAISPPLVPRTHVTTLNDGPIAIQRLMTRAPAVVSLALALVGLLLASVGVYGLIAQIVVRRTQEIGIHMALGARADQVVALVIRKTLRPVMWGAVFGGMGALAVSFVLRAMSSAGSAPDLTFGTGPFNPIVFGVVIATLLVVVLAACYLPAKRAASVDPTVALRAE